MTVKFAGTKTRTTHAISTAFWLIDAKKSAATGKWIANFKPISGRSNFNRFTQGFATHADFMAKVEEIANLKPSDSSYVPSMQKNPAKTKRRSLKNPALDYGDEATASVLASYMQSVYKNGKALRAHLKKIAKTSAYSEAKYIAFLVKSHLPTVAVEYYRNARDAKQYATANVKKRAAELFIEDTLDGSYD